MAEISRLFMLDGYGISRTDSSTIPNLVVLVGRGVRLDSVSKRGWEGRFKKEVLLREGTENGPFCASFLNGSFQIVCFRD